MGMTYTNTFQLKKVPRLRATAYFALGLQIFRLNYKGAWFLST